MLQVVIRSRGYNHCWRDSAPRPSTRTRGDRYEDGCSDVSCIVAARGLGERYGPRPLDATRCTATATECSAANCSTAAAAEPGAGATTGPCPGAAGSRTSAADRAHTSAATRSSGAARIVGAAKSATTFVSAVAEIPISFVAAAISAAAAVPVIDTGDAASDDSSSAATAVGTL
jgi:hypothetical protein